MVQILTIFKIFKEVIETQERQDTQICMQLNGNTAERQRDLCFLHAVLELAQLIEHVGDIRSVGTTSYFPGFNVITLSLSVFQNIIGFVQLIYPVNKRY